MAKQGTHTGSTPKLISVAVASCFVASAALANPSGPAVVNGAVGFHQQGNLLQITSSPNSIIHWQSFSIGASEITRFLQQSASSAVLNRVISQNPSAILGALQSNGRVFLINPNGILFGAGAQIDVAGLVASTLNLSNADFLAGRLNFTEAPGAGSVVNHGNITAVQGGQVYLVGPSLTNSGIITSPKGEVILAAGNSVELVNPGTPNLRVEITAPDNQAVNLGQIVAESGRVGIYAGLINHSGTIRADSAVVGENGQILLRATKNATLDAGSVTTTNGPTGGSVTVQSSDTTLVAGTIEAKGSEGKGGTVQVLGNLVGLTGNAGVNVSGETGGGAVLAGGAFQGKPALSAVEGNPIQNAFRTFIGSDVTIQADAITSGDGGKVIVWSDDATRAYGTISARGGAQSGNGGFVETSGRRFLDVTRAPDLTAPHGLGGAWLLDPFDITVVAGVGTLGSSALTFLANANSSTVSNTVIQNALNAGTSVVLDTTGAGTQAGDINVNAPITVTGAVSPTLTLKAANNIFINSPITSPTGNDGAGGTSLVLILNHNALGTAQGTSVTLARPSMLQGLGRVDVQNAGVQGAGTLQVLGSGPSGLIGGGAAQEFHGDDGFFVYTLPFGFTYYGVSYNTMYVNTNGNITFGEGTSQYANNAAGFRTQRMIAPSWNDWRTDVRPGNDIYISQPSAGTLVVRWDVASYGNRSAFANFEAVLFQSGDIRFNYGAATNVPFNSAGDRNSWSTIGVSNGDNQHFTFSTYNNYVMLHNLPSTTFQYNSMTGNYIETLASAAPVLPPAVVQAVSQVNSQVVAAANQQTTLSQSQTTTGGNGAGSVAPADKDKKKPPICGAR